LSWEETDLYRIDAGSGLHRIAVWVCLGEETDSVQKWFCEANLDLAGMKGFNSSLGFEGFGVGLHDLHSKCKNRRFREANLDLARMKQCGAGSSLDARLWWVSRIAQGFEGFLEWVGRAKI